MVKKYLLSFNQIREICGHNDNKKYPGFSKNKDVYLCHYWCDLRPGNQIQCNRQNCPHFISLIKEEK